MLLATTEICLITEQTVAIDMTNGSKLRHHINEMWGRPMIKLLTWAMSTS